jgi:hypothetical protein
MSKPVYFNGANTVLSAPLGQELEIGPITLMRENIANVTCWELTDEEVADIIKHRRVYVGVLSGDAFYPQIVGTVSTFKGLPPQYKEAFN